MAEETTRVQTPAEQKEQLDEKIEENAPVSSRSSSARGEEKEVAVQPSVDVDATVDAERAVTTESVRRQRGRHGHVNDLSSVPNGGIRAWLQVAGAFVLFFNTWGVVNTYGVYQTYYELDILKGNSASSIAWIGSVQIFLLLLVGALTGPVYDSGYFRELLVVGSFLVVFGHMMLSLCKEFWQVLLAQAFAIGAGTGCLFVPSVAILSTYFTSRLALATGIAASGSSLGGVLYPIVLNRLIPRIGFDWAVRVIGFLCLGTLLVPNVVMKVRVLPPERRKIIDTTAFRDVPFLLFCSGLFVTFCGLFQPFFFVQTFAIVKKLASEDLSFYLLSILNATSTLGRILPNFVADKTGPFNMLLPCCLISGVLILCLLGVHNLGGILVFVLLFGFFSGSLVSLPPTTVVHLTANRRFIGTRMGMCFAFVAIGALIGSPIGGQIISNHGWHALWGFGGALATAGAFIITASRVAFKGWNPLTKA